MEFEVNNKATKRPRSPPNNSSHDNMSFDNTNNNDNKFLDRNSRQIGAYGLEAMTKLATLKVIIAGINGAAVETAKNLSLSGVHTITLVDSTVATEADLGVNFCISEASLTSHPESSRAELSVQLISDLNPSVRVKATTDLTEELVNESNVLILSTAFPDFSKTTAIRWNEYCRAHSTATHRISFILAMQAGIVGTVFVDHGDGFVTKDLDGKPMLQKLITEIRERVDKKGRKYTAVRSIAPAGMATGGFAPRTKVTFSSVDSVLQAGTGLPITDPSFLFDAVVSPQDAGNLIRLYPSLSELGFDASSCHGGFINEPKQPHNIPFASLADALNTARNRVSGDPFNEGPALDSFIFSAALLEVLDGDGNAKLANHDAGIISQVVTVSQQLNERGKQELEAFERGLKKEQEEAGNDAASESDPEMPFTLPEERPKPLYHDYLNVDFVRKAAGVAATDLQPFGTFWGAIIAQETIKTTGKFTPIQQFLSLTCVNTLPQHISDYSTVANDPNFQAGTGRYTHLVAAFGKQFVHRLNHLKLFMVGCGALGCESIKNFALNGMCTATDGMLVVTDNDRIEISNLSRQFLFREDNVGQFKSKAAANRARDMNKDIKIDSRQDFVGEKTYLAFPDAFWQQQDAVVNALDNMAARLYVDSRCVLYKKPLLESATMGTGGNVDTIIPGKTMSYADGGSADETGGIPMCTLRNFPYIFDHCIEWARAQFDDLFVFPFKQVEQFAEDKEAFITKLYSEVEGAGSQKTSKLTQQNEQIGALVESLKVFASKPTMNDCVALAWKLLHNVFRNGIRDLTTAFPRDAKKSNGEPFWSGHHKFPKEIDGSAFAEDPFVRDFLISTANMYASAFQIHEVKPPPTQNDPNNRWKREYRTTDFLSSAINNKLAVPEYQASAVGDLTEELSSVAAAPKKAEELPDEDELMKRNHALVAELRSLGAAMTTTPVLVDFEKDDDDNFHIDFITAAANLRAINYGIKTEDRMKVKLVAGRIIAAIATTTAAVTGLSLLEYWKLLQEKDTDDFFQANVDIGTNVFNFFNPDPPLKVRSHMDKVEDHIHGTTMTTKVIAIPNPFTKYDTIDIDVDATTTISSVADTLVEKLQELGAPTEGAELEISLIGLKEKVLWMSHQTEGGKRPILQAICDLTGEANFWSERVLFDGLEFAAALDEDEPEEGIDDVKPEFPKVVLHLKQ